MLKDLSDTAQGALVRGALDSARGLESARLLASTPLSSSPAPTSVDYLGFDPRIERTIVVDLAKGFATEPADRISKAWIEIRPINFEFSGYSVASTKFETVEVGAVQDNTTVQGSAGLTPTLIAKPETTGALGFQFGRSRTITVPVEQRVTDLNVGIDPKMLRIRREGLLNRDVGGNVFVSVALKPDQFHAEGLSQQGLLVEEAMLLAPSGEFRKAREADVTVSLVRFPSSCALKAHVRLFYELRKAGAKGRTYVEGDDDAKYVQDVRDSINILVPASEVRPDLWQIRPNISKDVRVVEAVTRAGFRQPILFDTYEKAQLFAQWMSQAAARTIGKELKLELSGLAMPQSYPILAARLLPRRCASHVVAPNPDQAGDLED